MVCARILSTGIAVGVMGALVAAPRLASAQQVLNGFETPAEMAQIKGYSAALTTTTSYVTQGSKAAQVTFQAASLPYIEFKPATPWDVSQGGGMAIDFANTEYTPLVVGVRIEDAKGYYRSADITLAPRAITKVRLPYTPASDPNGVATYGMRGLPNPFPGIDKMQVFGSAACDLTRITRMTLFTRNTTSAHTIYLDNIRLLPAFDMNAILAGTVDEFGQNAKGDWLYKVHSVSDLTIRKQGEAQQLAGTAQLEDRDRFGGWTGGPNLGAASFFRTAKVKGKWWLVTPDGNPFLSMGVNAVDFSTYGPTMLDGRIPAFSWIPTKTDPLFAHVGYTTQVYAGPVKQGYTFNFIAANAHRKYGDTWENDWLNMAVTRLKNWGFNTLGGWSDLRLYASKKMPYTVCGGTGGGDYAYVKPGGSGWYPFPDVFDPKYQQFVAYKFTSVTQISKNDPWCLGYFIDNEASWLGSGKYANYGIALGTLSNAASASPAKRAFVSQLTLKYGNINALNTSWDTKFKSWSDLNNPYSPTGSLPTTMVKDLADFCTRFARQYFSIVRTELKKKDPNHLYLGCRFQSYTPEVTRAAAENCDVLSFNIYQPEVDPQKWAFLNTLNKPCMVSEWHTGALDRGMFHPGIIAAKDQNDRAAIFQNYVRSIVDNPVMVGCHWFQYTDQPLTGRTFDGENYNIGLVDVTDTPYPELVAAAKAVMVESYPRRYTGP